MKLTEFFKNLFKSNKEENEIDSDRCPKNIIEYTTKKNTKMFKYEVKRKTKRELENKRKRKADKEKIRHENSDTSCTGNPDSPLEEEKKENFKTPESINRKRKDTMKGYKHRDILDFEDLHRQKIVEPWNMYSIKALKIKNMINNYREFKKFISVEHRKIFGNQSTVFEEMKKRNIWTLDRKVQIDHRHMHRKCPNSEERTVRCIKCMERVMRLRIRKEFQDRIRHKLQEKRHYLVCEKSLAWRRLNLTEIPEIRHLETMLLDSNASLGCTFHEPSNLAQKIRKFDDTKDYQSEDLPEYRTENFQKPLLELEDEEISKFSLRIREQAMKDRGLMNKLYINDHQKLVANNYTVRTSGSSPISYMPVTRCIEKCPFAGPLYFLYQRHGWHPEDEKILLKENLYKKEKYALGCGCEVAKKNCDGHYLHSCKSEEDFEKIENENKKLEDELARIKSGKESSDYTKRKNDGMRDKIEKDRKNDTPCTYPVEKRTFNGMGAGEFIFSNNMKSSLEEHSGNNFLNEKILQEERPSDIGEDSSRREREILFNANKEILGETNSQMSPIFNSGRENSSEAQSVPEIKQEFDDGEKKKIEIPSSVDTFKKEDARLQNINSGGIELNEHFDMPGKACDPLQNQNIFSTAQKERNAIFNAPAASDPKNEMHNFFEKRKTSFNYDQNITIPQNMDPSIFPVQQNTELPENLFPENFNSKRQQFASPAQRKCHSLFKETAPENKFNFFNKEEVANMNMFDSNSTIFNYNNNISDPVPGPNQFSGNHSFFALGQANQEQPIIGEEGLFNLGFPPQENPPQELEKGNLSKLDGLFKQGGNGWASFEPKK